MSSHFIKLVNNSKVVHWNKKGRDGNSTANTVISSNALLGSKPGSCENMVCGSGGQAGESTGTTITGRESI